MCCIVLLAADNFLSGVVRETTMRFECTNLVNHAEVKNYVDQEGKYTMDCICKSPVLSKVCRFGLGLLGDCSYESVEWVIWLVRVALFRLWE